MFDPLGFVGGGGIFGINGTIPHMMQASRAAVLSKLVSAVMELEERVRVGVLKGPHCQLLASGPAKFEEEVEALLALAAGAAPTAKLEYLTQAEVMARVEAEEADELGALGF